MKQLNPKKDKMNNPKFLIKNKKKGKNKNQKFLIDSENFTILGKKHHRLNKNNSLENLTKKFIKYINGLNTNCIDLKLASSELNITKRRIYDITNVLEGKQYYI